MHRTPVKILAFREQRRAKKRILLQALTRDGLAAWLQVIIALATLVYAVVAVDSWQKHDLIRQRTTQAHLKSNEIVRLLLSIKFSSSSYQIDDLVSAPDRSLLADLVRRPEFVAIYTALQEVQGQVELIEHLSGQKTISLLLHKADKEFLQVLECRKLGQFLLRPSNKLDTKSWIETAVSVLGAFHIYAQEQIIPAPTYMCQFDLDRIIEQMGHVNEKLEKLLQTGGR